MFPLLFNVCSFVRSLYNNFISQVFLFDIKDEGIKQTNIKSVDSKERKKEKNHFTSIQIHFKKKKFTINYIRSMRKHYNF